MTLRVEFCDSAARIANFERIRQPMASREARVGVTKDDG
jgi:hypothetical protein